MVKADSTRTLVVPRAVLDDAAFALHSLCNWIRTREFHISPVLAAMLEQGERAKIMLEAALRLRERLDPDGQPIDAAELARWQIVEETLQHELGVKFAPADRQLAHYYACERFAWQNRPANFAQLEHAAVERWAGELARGFKRAESAPAHPIPGPTSNPSLDRAIDDDLERARREEMHRHGERDKSQ